MKSDTEQNKQNAQDFYAMMFNECEPREAVERFVGAEYIQHNPLRSRGRVIEDGR